MQKEISFETFFFLTINLIGLGISLSRIVFLNRKHLLMIDQGSRTNKIIEPSFIDVMLSFSKHEILKKDKITKDNVLAKGNLQKRKTAILVFIIQIILISFISHYILKSH